MYPERIKTSFLKISSTFFRFACKDRCEALRIQVQTLSDACPEGPARQDRGLLPYGTKIENPKFLAKKLKYLRRQQRRLSRKVKGSANRGKQRQRVAVLHEKVTNARNDFLHKLTHALVENQDFESFAIEDLSVQKLQKGKLARHIGDAAWGTFRTMLEYKAIRKGKTVLVIGRFEPSSRLCTCGVINRSLKLSDREWTCDSCGTTHDRDVLAANNIRRLAFCKQDTSKPSVGRDTPEFTLVEPASAGVEARSPRINSGE